MFIAVLSDSHDNMENIRKAIELTEARGITHGFHLGDFCAPPAVIELGKSKITWQCVWGNVDGDRLASTRRAHEAGNVDIGENDFREINIEGRTVFLTHYPEIGRIAALSAQYDAVFHGHTHEAYTEVVGKTLLANPGEVAGFRFGKPSFGVYDTETNTIEHLPIA